jgi:catechol 2,3-dioxygenase-like lactoylglutathione lyase family enzyme
MKVTGFNHAAFNVDGKLADTVAFYTTTLGLVERERNAMASLVKGAWFQIDEHTQIHVADEPWSGEHRSPIGPHLSLWVDNIISAHSELQALGLKTFSLGSGSAQVVWLSDPGGKHH